MNDIGQTWVEHKDDKKVAQKIIGRHVSHKTILYIHAHSSVGKVYDNFGNFFNLFVILLKLK